ncbi:MAG: hypothetical protein JO249_24140 [Acidobacteria bacterium]|nr:hypothetical protein [Acidobacteriota bacterium]
MIPGRRDRVHRIETNANLLLRATWLLDRVHARLAILADSSAARQITPMITTIDTERQRWLRAVDSPLP